MEKSVRIHTIVTHVEPHLDEAVAVFLLRKFGQEDYPGVKTASIEYWPERRAIPGGKTRKEYEAEGYLFLGTWGGRFDEHQNGDADDWKKDGECAATLVAKDLGINRKPALANILKFTKRVDSGSSQPFEVSSIMKDLSFYLPGQSEMIMEWVLLALEAKYRSEAEFQDARREYADFRDHEEEIRVGKDTIRLVVVESDNRQIAKVARQNKVSIIIQRKSTGRVLIFTDKGRKLDIASVARAVRLEEQKKRGNVNITDWRELVRDGTIEEIPEWYFQWDGRMLFNGSISAPDMPATQISLDRIKELVIAGVSGQNLPRHCQQRRHCIRSDCRGYCYGFAHCKVIRQGRE